MSRLLDKMRASTDRGTPCIHCGYMSKDCAIQYIETNHRCCRSCDNDGARLAHEVTS